MKLNEGFSGEGNAILDLRPLQAVEPGAADSEVRVKRLKEQFSHLKFEAKAENLGKF